MVRASKNYYGDYLKLQIGRQFYGKMASLPVGKAPLYTNAVIVAARQSQLIVLQKNMFRIDRNANFEFRSSSSVSKVVSGILLKHLSTLTGPAAERRHVATAMEHV